MAVITEMPNYKLTNIILSKKHSFTFNEILEDIKYKGISISDGDIKLAVNRLKESGMIIQHGSRFSLYNNG